MDRLVTLSLAKLINPLCYNTLIIINYSDYEYVEPEGQCSPLTVQYSVLSAYKLHVREPP